MNIQQQINALNDWSRPFDQVRVQALDLVVDLLYGKGNIETVSRSANSTP
jgi:hypothetical protein